MATLPLFHRDTGPGPVEDIDANHAHRGPTTAREELYKRFDSRIQVSPGFSRKLVSYEGNKNTPGLQWMKYDMFSRLDPDRFQECFMEWIRSVAGLLPGEVGRRRQDGAPLPRQPGGQTGHPPGQRLVLCQHPDLGAGEDGGEIQRDHGHSPAAGIAGTERLHRNHRRHGLPEGDCSGDSGPGGGYLLAVKENQ